MIERVENNFLSIAERLRNKIAMLPDMKFREQLDLPRQVMLINKENPWRNAYRLEQAHAQEKYLKQTNINYFSYELLVDRSPHDRTARYAAAGYAPATRKFFFPREIIQMNILDFVVTAHELIHVAQDTKERAQLHTEQHFARYVHFYSTEKGEKPRIILNNETTAYAYELELLDMLLDGGLRTMVASRDKAATARLGSVVPLRSGQEKMLEYLIELAFLYFPAGLTRQGLPATFVHHVARAYRAIGYELYTREAGSTRKIHRHELPD